ncbi:MAG: hypothetical protein R3E79_59325 [Caldilineaceae bacterium]
MTSVDYPSRARGASGLADRQWTDGLTVYVAFHAGVVAWRSRAAPPIILHGSSKDGEFQWIKPWFGGIRPILAVRKGYPGKLH